MVFFEGDDAHEVLIITSGEVKVTVTSPDGREVVLDVLGPGELLGELSAIDGAPRSAGVATLGAVGLVAVDVARFNQFVDDHHRVAVALLRSVAGRLRHTTRRQVEFGTVDALGRVCGRIVEMMDRYGHPNAGRVDDRGPAISDRTWGMDRAVPGGGRQSPRRSPGPRMDHRHRSQHHRHRPQSRANPSRHIPGLTRLRHQPAAILPRAWRRAGPLDWRLWV